MVNITPKDIFSKSSNMEQKIKNLWKELNYPSAIKFFQSIKNKELNITYNKINDVLKKQESIQINKEVRKPSEFSTIIAPSIGYTYQLDIMVYNRFLKNKYKYVLCCVDVYSRRAEVEPMTTMDGQTILEKTKQIFKKFSPKIFPKNLNTDNQFNYKEFVEYLNKHNIHLYLSYADDVIDSKNSIVERFHRTLASMMRRYRSATRDYAWNQWIQKIIDLYNNSYHRTIKCTPMEAWNGTKKPEQEVNFVIPDFQTGDLVRTNIQKEIFNKGDAQTFSKDVYRVVKRNKQRFVLENIETGYELKRPYKPRELTKANNFEKVEPTQEQKKQKEEQQQEIEADKRRKRRQRENRDDSNIIEKRTRGKRVNVYK